MKQQWQTSTLGEVLAVLRNGVNCKQDKSGNGDRISRIESISDASFDLDRVGFAELSERDKERYRLQNGDILFSHINSAVHVGKTAVFGCPEPVYHGVNLLLMRPKDFLLSTYLEYALKYLFQSGYWRGVCKQSVNQASVNQQDISRVEFRYPDLLTEQRRIVGILDEAFEGLATAKANAEQNLQNARALFESHLQAVFTQRGDGWVEKRLEEVCGLQNGFAFKSSTFKPSGAPILRISNIQDGRIDADNRLVFFDPKDYRENLDRYRIVEGDLLIAMSGATTGKLGFNTERTVYYLNQRVGKFEPSDKLNKRFLYHFLSTKVEENLRISAGAAQPNLSTEQIKGFILPLPSVDEQERIVDALETLSEETQRLESLYQRKLAALDALKNSLLHRAFSGQL